MRCRSCVNQRARFDAPFVFAASILTSYGLAPVVAVVDPSKSYMMAETIPYRIIRRPRFDNAPPNAQRANEIRPNIFIRAGRMCQRLSGFGKCFDAETRV
jgi:hypothetical protein